MKTLLLKPTLADYLASREGREWTPEDSLWVRQHCAQVESLAEALIRRHQQRKPDVLEEAAR